MYDTTVCLKAEQVQVINLHRRSYQLGSPFQAKPQLSPVTCKFLIIFYFEKTSSLAISDTFTSYITDYPILVADPIGFSNSIVVIEVFFDEIKLYIISPDLHQTRFDTSIKIIFLIYGINL